MLSGDSPVENLAPNLRAPKTIRHLERREAPAERSRKTPRLVGFCKGAGKFSTTTRENHQAGVANPGAPSALEPCPERREGPDPA